MLKCKNIKKNQHFSGSDNPRMLFFLLINIQTPTTGILTFLSGKSSCSAEMNYRALNHDDLEKYTDCIYIKTKGERFRVMLFFSLSKYESDKEIVVILVKALSRMCPLYGSTIFSHPLDKNIPFYRCLRFFYPGLLSQPRL